MSVAGAAARETSHTPAADRGHDQKTAFNPTTTRVGAEKTGSSTPASGFMATAETVGDFAVNIGGVLSVASLACPILEPLSVGVNLVGAARMASTGDMTGALSTLAQAIPGEGAIAMGLKGVSKSSECLDSANSFAKNIKNGNFIGTVKDGASVVATVLGAGKLAKFGKTAETVAKVATVAEHGHSAIKTAGDALKKGDVLGAIGATFSGGKNVATTLQYSRSGKHNSTMGKAATVAGHGAQTAKDVAASHAKGDHLATAKTVVNGLNGVANTLQHSGLQTVVGKADAVLHTVEDLAGKVGTVKGLLANGNFVAAAGVTGAGLNTAMEAFKEATGKAPARTERVVSQPGVPKVAVNSAPKVLTESNPAAKTGANTGANSGAGTARSPEVVTTNVPTLRNVTPSNVTSLMTPGSRPTTPAPRTAVAA